MLLHHILKPQFIWATKMNSCVQSKWNTVYRSALQGSEDMNSKQGEVKRRTTVVREVDCLFYMIKARVWVSLVGVKADLEFGWCL